MLTTNRKSTDLLQKTVNVKSKMGRVKKSARNRVPPELKMAEGFKLFQILIIIFQDLNITISKIDST